MVLLVNVHLATMGVSARESFGILIVFTLVCSGTLVLTHQTACASNQSRIVGLFKPLGYQDRAVQLAYDNQSTSVCYESLSTASSTMSWQDICGLLSGGVLALISDQPLPSAVNDVIGAARLPVLSTSIITTDTDSTVVSIAPPEEQLAGALSSLIKYNLWTEAVLLTWQGSGLELFMPGSSNNYIVTAVYYTDTSDMVMRSKLSKIRKSSTTVIILHHYDLDEVLHIFKMAAEEGLDIFPYIWILLGKTAKMLMTKISEGVMLSRLPRLLGVYPIVSSNPQLREFATTWRSYGSVKQLQSAAYLHDAMKILSDSVDLFNRNNPNFTQIQQPCDSLGEWHSSNTFQAILNETITTTQRLTSESRSVYYFFSIDQYGLNKIANWTEESDKLEQISFIRWCSQQELSSLPLCHKGNSFRCNIKSPPLKAPDDSNYQYDYSRYSFDVVTLQAEPFIQVTKTDNGDEKLEGLCIDLLNKLSEKMGFHYTIRLVADGQYGGQLEDGSWTGLVGDLIERKAEIAVAPLTITSNRETVIDFTKAYFDLGLRVLYNRNDNNNDFSTFKLFKFLRPFELDLWLLILASTAIISAALAIIGRLSPYDWYQNPPDDFSLWESRFQMTFYNSVWQSLSGILQQGSETAPRSTSARILMGGWWFVCLVLGATFTANLTAIFAIQENDSGFNSIEELVSKIPPDILFGTYNNSQPAAFFKFSPIKQYQEAYEYMRTERLLYNSEKEALSAVLYDDIALIFDSPIIDFISSRRSEHNPHCTLKDIGQGLFFPASYGLGLTKDSPYTDDFSLAILEIVEEGEMERLTNEYFEFQRTCVSEIAITGASASMDTEQITLDSVGGLFILLGIAIVLSFIILLIEFAYNSLQKRISILNLWNSLSLKLPWEDELIQTNKQPFIEKEVSSLNSEINEMMLHSINTEL